MDTETTGLSLIRDRLCMVQIAFSKTECHLIKFDKDFFDRTTKHHKVRDILKDEKIEKIFHFARFDIAMLNKFLKLDLKNIFCTKIASKLVRTYTDKHGLRDLCIELLNIDLNKSQQSSDWSSENLSESQIKYASYDVIFLFELKSILEKMLKREERFDIAKSCFQFLPTRVKLDFLDWHNLDIFSH